MSSVAPRISRLHSKGKISSEVLEEEEHDKEELRKVTKKIKKKLAEKDRKQELKREREEEEKRKQAIYDNRYHLPKINLNALKFIDTRNPERIVTTFSMTAKNKRLRRSVIPQIHRHMKKINALAEPEKGSIIPLHRRVEPETKNIDIDASKRTLPRNYEIYYSKRDVEPRSISQDAMMRVANRALTLLRKSLPKHLTGIRKSVAGGENDNRKVIVPVEKNKLEKVLMFYYLKRKFPKLVKKFLDEEESGRSSGSLVPESEFSHITSKMTDSPNHENKFDPMGSLLNGMKLFSKMNDLYQTNDDNSTTPDNATDTESLKSLPFREKLAKIDEDLEFFKNMSLSGMISFANENHSSTTEPKENSESMENANETIPLKAPEEKCEKGVKCMLKTLVTLMDKNQDVFDEAEDKLIPSKPRLQPHGIVRGGSDPYATIGHAPMKHMHDDEEEEHHCGCGHHDDDDDHHHHRCGLCGHHDDDDHHEHGRKYLCT